MPDEPLAESHCVPCKGGVEPLKVEAARALLEQLSPDWQMVENRHLERLFTFKNFREALAFVNRVGELAEAQNHHPDICLGWGKVKLTLRTHKIDGLHDNDFILASKIDRL